MLRDLELNPVYDSSDHDLINELIVPLLSESAEYWRGVGFFTSGWIQNACSGVVQLLDNKGKARIITSPVVQSEDWEAFQLGERARSDPLLISVLRRSVRELSEALSHDTLNALAWLVAEDRMEFRFALPKTKSNGGAYHDKVGVFIDKVGDTVAIHGSFNDSKQGSLNGEAFSVFKSWDLGQKPYVKQHFERLTKLWLRGNSQFNTVLLPDAIRDDLISMRSHPRPSAKSHCNPINEISPPHQVGKTSDIHLRDYQNEAIQKWQSNNCRGIFEMATGTGKTFTALAAAVSELAKREHLVVVILVPYLHLLDQWKRNAESFGFNPILCSGNHSNWNRDVRSKIQDFKIGANEVVCIIAVQATAVSERFLRIADLLPSKDTLLIADEVHRLGSKELRAALFSNASLRLGLSATPHRWYDEEGTDVLMSYFDGVCYEFTLNQAIGEFLTPYRYHPVFVELSHTESGIYMDLSTQIAQILSSGDSLDPESKRRLEYLLRERSKIIASAENKLPTLISLLETQLEESKRSGYEMRDILVYCAPGKHRGVLSAISALGLRCHEFVHRVSMKDRQKLLTQFESGEIQVLVAIKCLDEGVDVPSTRVAYFLASTSNPKEFIQRRGRVLRKHSRKRRSEIFDFIVTPDQRNPTQEDSVGISILKREMPRFAEFSGSATNQYEARAKILGLLNSFGVFHFVDMKPWDIYHEVMEKQEIMERGQNECSP